MNRLIELMLDHPVATCFIILAASFGLSAVISELRGFFH